MTKSDKLREFAHKYGVEYTDSPFYSGFKQTANSVKTCLSDLTALLEQHKEMMMEFTEWTSRKNIEGLVYVEANKKWGVCELGNFIEFTTAELFDYWLKNVKK